MDFALYSSPKSGFTVVQYGIKTLLIGGGTGSEGSDSLIRVERLVFPDVSVALDLGVAQSSGQAPDALTLASAVSSLDSDPQGDYLWHLAASVANQTQIGLTGLAQDGLVFV